MSRDAIRLRQTGVLFVFFVAFGALFPRVTVAEAADRPVRIAISRDPISFDPHGAIDPSAPVVLGYVYDTLVYQRPDGSLVPNLARSWRVTDSGRTITFLLKRDVRFSNGEYLTAESVRFTLERLRRIGQRSYIYSEIANITAIETPDRWTVVLRLDKPSVPLLSALSYAYAAILDPSAVADRGENYGRHPVGTGPYRVTRWRRGTSIDLEPNRYYNGHRPFDEDPDDDPLRHIEIVFAPQEQTRAHALRAGEIDMAYFTSRNLAEEIATDGGFRILTDDVRGIVYLGLNTRSDLLSAVEMRKAIAGAVSREELVAFMGDGTPTATVIPPSIPGSLQPNTPGLPTHDLASARGNLAKAGYRNQTVRIVTSTFPTYQTIATIIQGQLSRAGIRSSIDVYDYSTIREIARNGEYDIVVTRYGWNDPDLLRIYLGSEAVGRTNRSAYTNERFDRLVEAARGEFDQSARFALYRRAQRIVAEDLPWIPLYMPKTYAVVSDRISGARMANSHMLVDDLEVVQN